MFNQIVKDKHCFVYCGDDICDCKKSLFSITNYLKFEDKYEILSYFAYLNHAYYEYFENYLIANNKIAIVFCISDDELFLTKNSPLIKKHKVSNKQDKNKILEEYMLDFYAFESIAVPNLIELKGEPK